MNNIKSQLGITMIELMVSLFIFSIGLLGFATLQTRSLQEGIDSGQRSIALWRSQELSDRIRANADQLDAYLASVNNDAICESAAPRCADYLNNGVSTDAGVCTAAEMAIFDTWDVLCNGDDATNDVLIDSKISLSCNDFDTSDALACSFGSNLTLDICWTSKSASSDNQIEVVQNAAALPSCDNPNAPSYLFESYSLEFLP